MRDGQVSGRDKWNARYAGETITEAPAPARVLSLYAHLLPQAGVALDLACGKCGSGLFLAKETQLLVNVWDFSTEVIRAVTQYAADTGLTLKAEVHDAAEIINTPSQFDVIVVSRFLQRELFPAIKAALRPGGVLFYQTFVVDKVTDSGPSNPDFLLSHNELLALSTDLRVLAYHDEAQVGDIQQGYRNEAFLVAQKPLNV